MTVLSVSSVPHWADADEAIGANDPIGTMTPGADAPLPMLDDEPDLGGDYLERVLDRDWDDFEGLDLRHLFQGAETVF